ncbi:MAG: hypothetical protein Q8R28_05760, partial [Dehalococcoidia bacterium]|nr:hypothetical protein [Dehalococcoidia bacterium]
SRVGLAIGGLPLLALLALSLAVALVSVLPAGQQRPAHAAFPGRDGKIAFVRADGIYVIGADGTGLAKLASNPQIGSRPAWSSDGAKIAFRCASSICLMNADGTGRTDLQTTGSQPAWSPNGSSIAFVRNDDILVMKTDGTGLTNLTNSPKIEGSPAWSPAGSKIAFTRSDTPGGNYGIYMTNADGSGQTVFFDSPGNDEWGPEWSPDGTRIAFGQGLGIAVMNADGSGALAAGPSLGPNLGLGLFAWSPGGTKFAIYAYDLKGQTMNGGLYIVNADDTTGASKVRLTDEPGDHYPSWQVLPLSQRPLAYSVYIPMLAKNAVISALARKTWPRTRHYRMEVPLPPAGGLRLLLGALRPGRPALALPAISLSIFGPTPNFKYVHWSTARLVGKPR